MAEVDRKIRDGNLAFFSWKKLGLSPIFVWKELFFQFSSRAHCFRCTGMRMKKPLSVIADSVCMCNKCTEAAITKQIYITNIMHDDNALRFYRFRPGGSKQCFCICSFVRQKGIERIFQIICALFSLWTLLFSSCIGMHTCISWQVNTTLLSFPVKAPDVKCLLGISL